MKRRQETRGRRPNSWEWVRSRLIVRPSGCWEWPGGVNRGGYGKIRVMYRHTTVHRFAWESTYGQLTPEKYVLHICDNPRCGNPRHLFLGDAGTNYRDAMVKGRMRIRNSGALTLTTARKVKEFFAAGVSKMSISKRLGVNPWTVKNVLDGQIWKRA